MVTANGPHHNTNGANGQVNGAPAHVNGNGQITQMLEGPSDHIDVTPGPPRPKWPDTWAPYRHSLSWQDDLGISHTVSLCNSTLQGLLDDSKMIMAGVRKAKERAAQRQPQSGAQPVLEPDADVPPCPVHHVPMQRKQSKRTGGVYFSHKMADGSGLCFGRTKS